MEHSEKENKKVLARENIKNYYDGYDDTYHAVCTCYDTQREKEEGSIMPPQISKKNQKERNKQTQNKQKQMKNRFYSWPNPSVSSMANVIFSTSCS